MRKPQCTVVHEDFRSKRNVESTLWGRPLLPRRHSIYGEAKLRKSRKQCKSETGFLFQLAGGIDRNGLAVPESNDIGSPESIRPDFVKMCKDF